MKTILVLFLAFIVNVCVTAQESILFSGRIETADFNFKKNKYSSANKTREADIYIFEGSQVLEKITCSKNGEFSIYLRPDLIYKFQFKKEGYISKCLQINTNNLTVDYLSKNQKVESDITLFQKIEGVDFSSYEKLPVARCSFQKPSNQMRWDMNYSEQTYSTFLSMVSSKDKIYRPRITKTPENSEVILDEEFDYTEESEWLNRYLEHILKNLENAN